MRSSEKVYTISGDLFVSRQTEAIKRMFWCSRPKPRNKAMGFKPKEVVETLRKLGMKT